MDAVIAGRSVVACASVIAPVAVTYPIGPASCVNSAAAPTMMLLLEPRLYAIYFTSFILLKGLVSSDQLYSLFITSLGASRSR